MDIADDALRYVEPGDLDRSDLYQHLLGEEELMPPEDENDPLSDQQIQTVATWIMQGADWPEGMNLTEVARVQAADTPAVGQTPAIGQTTDETTGETTDPAAEPAKIADDTVYRAIGSLHPAAVHLPIGLLHRLTGQRAEVGNRLLDVVRHNPLIAGDCGFIQRHQHRFPRRRYAGRYLHCTAV